MRDRGEISGPDFRTTHTVQRDVYALFGTVRAGNSGGPLLAPDGSVLGVVFASAIDDPDTGYALTADAGVRGGGDREDGGRGGRTPAPASEEGPRRVTVPRRAMAAVTASGASSCGKWPTPGSSRHS